MNQSLIRRGVGAVAPASFTLPNGRLITLPPNARGPVRNVGDFVPGRFPLPATPIYDPANGVGDFVNGGFPLPQTPVYAPSVSGSLPKVADLTQRDLAPLPAKDSLGMGCGCGCTEGMGSILDDATTYATTFMEGETFGVKNTYLAAGAVIAFLLFTGSQSGRRRR